MKNNLVVYMVSIIAVSGILYILFVCAINFFRAIEEEWSDRER